eukprot:3014465-Rhodomonas_salina.1
MNRSEYTEIEREKAAADDEKKPKAVGGGGGGGHGIPEGELLGTLSLVGLIYFTAAGGAYGSESVLNSVSSPASCMRLGGNSHDASKQR